MQSDPASALTSVGYKLSPAQRRALADPKLKAPIDVDVAKIPWTKPLVRIVTKGTKPVVSVAVQTVLTAAPTRSAASKKTAKKKR